MTADLVAPPPPPAAAPASPAPAAAPPSLPPDDDGIGWHRLANTEELTAAKEAESVLGGFRSVTDLAACVMPLLRALHWEGAPVHVAESMPYFAPCLELTDFFNVMANLGFASESLQLRPSQMDPRLMPCLYLPPDGMALVLIRRTAEGVLVYDPELRDYRTMPPPGRSGMVCFFRELDDEERMALEEAPRNFFAAIVGRFRKLFTQILLASLVSNLLVMSTPLFIMAIYDYYLPTGALPLLLSLLAGTLVALAGDVVMRMMRGRMIAYMGARLDHLLGLAVFRRLLLLAPAYTEQSNANAKIARLRDFETVRDFFTGPLATTLAEVPFVVVFLIAMALLGGILALVPLAALVVFSLMAMMLRPVVERSVHISARAGAKRQEFILEALSEPRVIKEAGATGIWIERYRQLSGEAAIKNHKAARTMSILTATSQAVVVLSGLGTLTLGVHRVLQNEMSVGGLMASMIMVWWVLRPLQTMFSLGTQLARTEASVAQINRLMQIRPERASVHAHYTQPRLKGVLNMTNLSLRYSPDADPALLGVSLQVGQGEVVGLIGPNGSGKSSLLKVVLGLYRPQTGTVTLDNIDIRQLDPIELRRQVAYVPQSAEMFFGTIAQNLRLVRPTASEEELCWACEEAGVLEEVRGLPDGFNTRIGDGRTDRLSASFRQRLSLARAYLKRAPLTLFDEPASGLDFDSDRKFMQTLERMRGHSSVLLVTHRPSHLKLTDRVAVIAQGQLRMVGPADQVLSRLSPGFF